MTLGFGQADVTQLRLQRTRLRSEAEALEDALERQRAQARSAAREGAGFSGFVLAHTLCIPCRCGTHS